jgi:hypothetical protein
MAACPLGVLPLAEQDNAIADDLRQWITPDFILEYQDEIHDAKRWRAQRLATSQDELTVDTPEMYTQQQVLEYFMDKVRGFVDDHQEVISCLTEMLCEQHELSGEDATRYLNEWAIRWCKNVYDRRFDPI